jgi:hypothetical protein
VNLDVLHLEAACTQRGVLKNWRFGMGHGIAENTKSCGRRERFEQISSGEELTGLINRLVHREKKSSESAVPRI